MKPDHRDVLPNHSIAWSETFDLDNPKLDQGSGQNFYGTT